MEYFNNILATFDRPLQSMDFCEVPRKRGNIFDEILQHFRTFFENSTKQNTTFVEQPLEYLCKD